MSALKKICGILLSAAVLATALYSAISVAAVDTSGAKTEEWLYDFKAGTGTENAAPSFLSGTAASTESFNADQWFYNSNSSTNKSYVDQNGLHINLNYVNTVTRDSSGGSWYKRSGCGMPIMTAAFHILRILPTRITDGRSRQTTAFRK